MSKRKIRDEDVDDARTVYPQRTDAQVDRGEASEQEQHDRYSISGLRFATESWAGIKTNNEDRHVSSMTVFPGPVFGIFDGHGGMFSADFLSRHLVSTVASELSRREETRKNAIVEQLKLLHQQVTELEAMRSGSEENSDDDVQLLVHQLKVAISQMDNEVKQIDAEQAARQEERGKWHREQHHCFLKSFREAFERVDSQVLQKNPSEDGSTALLVWFLVDSAASDNPPGELQVYTLNVGDCRAVMCRGKRGIALTRDHKPDRPDEKQRIEKAGGFVGKIAGISRVYSAAGAGLALQSETSTYLAVSRAFGDRSLKTPTPLVSCEPEIQQFTVEGEDLFLVLACDGIWDVLSEQDAVDIALPHFDDAKAAADAIVKAAYKKGSADNLTATVVQFGWKSKDEILKAQVEDGSDEEIDMFSL